MRLMIFADEIIVYTENAKESTGLRLEYVNLASLLQMYTNIHTQRNVFLYNSNK